MQSYITILAPHDCQVRAIKTQLAGCLKVDQQVNVSSVDEFQGQDSHIVLLSLTAGNEDEAHDVILEEGWISVALSRAKVGLYVIGNFDVLSCQSPLWSKIVATAEEDEIIGWWLPVYCQNHPSTKKRLVNVTDFGRCPEGGCGRPCEHLLPCGHRCVLSCHGYDITHVKYKCSERCSKSCKAGHPCEKHCFMPCRDCLVPVLKVFPVCGHLNEIPCYQDPEVCKQECSHKLPCEHKCSAICCKTRSGNVHKECPVLVTYIFSPCGHYGQVPCHKWNTQVPCDKPCEVVLRCGHRCKGSCSRCLLGAVHEVCQEKCPKRLPCGHKCTGYCGTPCLPCPEICPFRCSHKSCQSETHRHKCGQPCPPCMEQCVTQCKHVSGTKLCSQQWKIRLCNKMCNRKFEIVEKDPEASGKNICNHNCAGICGELCVCLHCDRVNDLKEVGSNLKQTLDEGLVSKILDNLEEKLIFKIPSCAHIFYVEQLDAFIADNAPVGTSFILCPVCPKPIMKCKRYDNVLNARHKRRDDQKALLLSRTSVSKDETLKLKHSFEILKMMASPFHKSVLFDKSHSYNTIELQAISFKMKIVFVLVKILKIGPRLRDEVEMDLLAMTYSAFRSPNRLSSQRKQESLFEVLRCLKLKVLNFLEDLNCQHVIQAPRSLTWQVESMISVLRGSQRNPENLSKADSVIMSIIKMIGESSPAAQAACCPVIKKYKELIGVLLSSDSMMLCDLVHPDEAQTVPDLTPVADQQSDLKQDLTADLQTSGPYYSPSTDHSPRQTADEGQSFYGKDTKLRSTVDLDHHEITQEGCRYQDMFDVNMFKVCPEMELRPAETVADKKEPLYEEEQFPILLGRPVEAKGQSPTKPGVSVSGPDFFKTKRDNRLHPFFGQQNSQINQMSSNVDSAGIQSGPSFSEMCSRPATGRPVKQTRGKMPRTDGDTGIDKEQTSKVHLKGDEMYQDECRVQGFSTVDSIWNCVKRPGQTMTGKNEPPCEEEQFPSLIVRSSERNDNLLTKPEVTLSDPKFSTATTTWGNHAHPFVGHQNSQTKHYSSDVDSASVQSKPSLSEVCSSPVVHKQRTSGRVKPKHGKIPFTYGDKNRVAMTDSKKGTRSTTFNVSSEADFPTLGGSKK
ncbi:unnamed protein product [Lymnaea stagnalis]|uniref:DNA2/NAM7 helicase-like C-terminal domain-containing protein n=1 Tax=Lymnaea stagnalis TaxID=6523 RepID=A0AAV2HNI5_LYMST